MKASDLVPMTWVDPLLSGDKKVNLDECSALQIERLLQAIKKRIEDWEANG